MFFVVQWLDKLLREAPEICSNCIKVVKNPLNQFHGVVTPIPKNCKAWNSKSYIKFIMFKNLLVMIILVDAKFDWNFQVKRVRQKLWRPVRFNQLLANLQSHKEQNKRVYFTQKIRNPNFGSLFRGWLARLTTNVKSWLKTRQRIESIDFEDFIKINLLLSI